MSNHSKSDLVDIDLITVHETAAAWCVALDEDSEEVWLPKSAVERDGGTYTIPERLAEQKGLV